MDSLSFHKVYSHMATYTLLGTKIGYFLGNNNMEFILVKGVDPNGAGRWLASLNGEVSYVSPNLYELLENNIHMEITGQTLADGTVMSEERARAISTNSLPVLADANVPRRTRTKKPQTKERKKREVSKIHREATLTEPEITALRKKDVAVIGFLKEPKKESPLPDGCSKYLYKDGKKVMNTARTDAQRAAHELVCRDNEENLSKTVVHFI